MKISTAVTITLELEEIYAGTLEQAETEAGFKVNSQAHRIAIKEMLKEVLQQELSSSVTELKTLKLDKFVSAASNWTNSTSFNLKTVILNLNTRLKGEIHGICI